MAEGHPQHGEFGWTQLLTGAPGEAVAFYQALLGWSARRAELEGVEQHLMYNGERPVASILGVPAEVGEAMPHWHPHLGVDDVDARVALAEELGGRVVVAPGDIAGVGRLAVIQDPTGAVLTLVGPIADAAPAEAPDAADEAAEPPVPDAVDVDGD